MKIHSDLFFKFKSARLVFNNEVITHDLDIYEVQILCKLSSMIFQILRIQNPVPKNVIPNTSFVRDSIRHLAMKALSAV
jgi:hypothetical protein